MVIKRASENPIILEGFLSNILRKKKKSNYTNDGINRKISSSDVQRFRKEYAEYLERIPKLSSEEQSKYRDFMNKMLDDMEKVLDKIIDKYPKVKKAEMFGIYSLDDIIEFESDADNLNEFIYVYLNDESRKDSYVNKYNDNIVFGSCSADNIGITLGNYDILNDQEFQYQFNETFNDIVKEMSKLGYGRVDVDCNKWDGIIYVYDITKSPKFKQYFK